MGGGLGERRRDERGERNLGCGKCEGWAAKSLSSLGHAGKSTITLKFECPLALVHLPETSLPLVLRESA
jgi:hypothetical protein